MAVSTSPALAMAGMVKMAHGITCRSHVNHINTFDATSLEQKEPGGVIWGSPWHRLLVTPATLAAEPNAK